MDKNKDQLLAYCGLYCGNCLYHLNAVRDYKLPNDEGVIITCDGCNSSNCAPYCSICDIKKCNREKGIRYCLKCKEYPCDKLQDFMDAPKYTYHLEVPENMKLLEEVGFDKWVQEMEAKYTCKKCGNHFSYFDGACLDCNDK